MRSGSTGQPLARRRTGTGPSSGYLSDFVMRSASQFDPADARTGRPLGRLLSVTGTDVSKDAYEPALVGGSTHDATTIHSSLSQALLLLGRGSDPASERGVDCPGDLPPASDPGLVERARAAKAALGERVFVLGHHYQRDEVIQFADVTGDSFKLARDAAARPQAEYIVFCGVHFMAESADILTADRQQVVLPDLAAGCSMADMARDFQVSDAWDG